MKIKLWSAVTRTAIKIKEEKLVTIKGRLVKTSTVSQMSLVPWSAARTRSPTWDVIISQKCEVAQGSWPWVGSRAPKWNLERSWIDCHWRCGDMISVFLLLLLSHVRLTFREDDTTDDSGVRGAVPLPVFVPKLAAHQPGVQQVALMSAFTRFETKPWDLYLICHQSWNETGCNKQLGLELSVFLRSTCCPECWRSLILVCWLQIYPVRVWNKL